MLDAKIAIGHVCGDLLMARRDHGNVRPYVVEGIEHSHIAVAADAENVGNFLLDEKFRNQFAALRHGCSPLDRKYPDRPIEFRLAIRSQRPTMMFQTV